MNSDEILRRNVTRLREERGWSIQDLATRLGIDRTYLSKSESGNRAFKVSEIDKLSKIFGVSTDYLLGIKNDDGTPEYRAIQRQAKDMTPSDQKKLLQIMKVAFGDDYDD